MDAARLAKDQLAAVRIIGIVTSSLSLAACIATVLSALFVNRIKKHPLSRSAALHAAILIPATAAKLVPATPLVACIAAGTLVQVGEFAATLWLAVMAYLAAAVSFFGVNKRKQVRRTEWRALALVVVLSAVSVLPSTLWGTREKQAMYEMGAGWCWISASQPEVRLLSLLVPTLLVLVCVIGGVVPTTYYVLSKPPPPPKTQSYASRKMSLWSRSSVQLSPKIGAHIGQLFMRPYARGTCVYLIAQVLVVWLPLFLARLQATVIASVAHKLPPSEQFSLGWALVEVLMGPLAGFVGFNVLFFLAYLAESGASETPSNTPSATPTLVAFDSALHPVEHRASAPSFNTQRQRRMSRKRSRMLSSAGMEEVWKDEKIHSGSENEESDDSGSSSSSGDEHAAPRRPSQAHSIGAGARIVTTDIHSPMTRRASKAVDPMTGRVLTWAERRRLLLEQQQAPALTSAGLQPLHELGSPRGLSPLRQSVDARSMQSMDLDGASMMSDFDDDPMSMHIDPKPAADTRRGSGDVFRPS